MSNVQNKPSPRKLAFSREMRANPTDFEKKLWPRLKNMKCHKFTDQVVMGGYILDFYCPELKLAVELDGRQHDIHYDTTRDSQLNSMFGITILRFPNPKDEVAVNAILYRVRAECRWRLARIKKGFPTFPNRSSLATDKPIQPRERDFTVETCEYVQKPGACYRQVYATALTAQTTAIALRTLGIDANVERCPSCHLIHLKETRVVVPLPPKPTESPVWHKPFHYEVFDNIDALKKARG